MTAFDLILNHPLFGIAATLVAYLAANSAWRKYGAPALLHPILIATAVLASILLVTGLSYDTYSQQTFVLNEALGVVIVLLAVPLTRQARLIGEAGWPLVSCSRTFTNVKCDRHKPDMKPLYERCRQKIDIGDVRNVARNWLRIR